jgi:hypothetical protein
LNPSVAEAVRFNPQGMWGPNGRAFNQGVIEPEGRVLHVTGQVAWDAEQRVIYPGDVDRYRAPR